MRVVQGLRIVLNGSWFGLNADGENVFAPPLKAVISPAEAEIEKSTGDQRNLTTRPERPLWPLVSIDSDDVIVKSVPAVAPEPSDSVYVIQLISPTNQMLAFPARIPC